MHPEWAEYMGNGRPKWWWAVDRYLMSFQDIHRDWIGNVRKGQRHGDWGKWFGAKFNFYDLDVVEYGAREILRSADMFGWDGVRFDDQFTMESRWDGGVDFEGNAVERGESFDWLSARNTRRTEDVMRAARPDFLIGYNYASLYADRGIRMPSEYKEACDEGDFVMLEHTVWWHNHRSWQEVYRLLAQESRLVRGYGGVPGYVRMGTAGAARRIESAIAAATSTHHYNMPTDEWTVRYARFAMRFSELFYDIATLKDVTEPTELLEVTPKDELFWQQTVRTQQTNGTTRVIVHLVNRPDEEMVKDTKQMPPPVQNVTVKLKHVPATGVKRALLLTADDGPRAYVRPLDVKRTDAGVAVVVPQVDCWSCVVFELRD